MEQTLTMAFYQWEKCYHQHGVLVSGMLWVPPLWICKMHRSGYKLVFRGLLTCQEDVGGGLTLDGFLSSKWMETTDNFCTQTKLTKSWVAWSGDYGQQSSIQYVRGETMLHTSKKVWLTKESEQHWSMNYKDGNGKAMYHWDINISHI